MNYIKLQFELTTDEDADIISALLASMTVQGFEQTEHSLLAFFYENEFDEAELQAILAPFSYTYTLTIIPHENWNAQWEANFEPIIINAEVGVRAHFHKPLAQCQHDIVITPKMSFGTGHHQTTHMMLEYECDINFEHTRVLDFGCGTGVLAIFAKLKGASYVLGIDNDPWSVENAIENCEQNGVASIDISIDDLSTLAAPFDIILANINLNVLLQTLPTLKKLLNPQGQLLLSGILASDIPSITHCFTGLGFRLVSQKQKKEWVAMHLTVEG